MMRKTVVNNKNFNSKYSKVCLAFRSFNVSVNPTDGFKALQNALLFSWDLPFYTFSGFVLCPTADEYCPNDFLSDHVSL